MKMSSILRLAVVAAAIAFAWRASSANAAFFYEYSTTVNISNVISPAAASVSNGTDPGDTSTITDGATGAEFLLHSIADTATGGDHIEVSAGNPIVLATDSFQALTDTAFLFDFDFEIVLTLTAYADSLNDDTVNPPMPAGSIDISGHVVSSGDRHNQITTITGFTTDPASGLFFSGTQPVQISGFDSSPPKFGEGSGPGSITAILSDPNDANDGSAPEASSLAIWGVFGLLGLAVGKIKKS
jgi:hypothetical protein